jgi:hypothetical protein
MSRKTAAEIKNIWDAIFTKRGGNGTYTRLFDRLESSQRVAILSKVELGDSEMPVIGSYCDADNWLLLTTDRLVWLSSGVRNELATKSIRDAVADLAQIQRTGATKLEMCELDVLTMEGAHFSIPMEAGSPLSGIWNILKNIGATNRNSASSADY